MTEEKYMLLKLVEDYTWTQKMGNGGHMVGYYRDLPEKIQSSYVFSSGEYILRRKNNDFFLWYYKPVK